MLSGIYCILYELFYTVHCMSNVKYVDCHVRLSHGIKPFTYLLNHLLTYLLIWNQSVALSGDWLICPTARNCTQNRRLLGLLWPFPEFLKPSQHLTDASSFKPNVEVQWCGCQTQTHKQTLIQQILLYEITDSSADVEDHLHVAGLRKKRFRVDGDIVVQSRHQVLTTHDTQTC